MQFFHKAHRAEPLQYMHAFVFVCIFFSKKKNQTKQNTHKKNATKRSTSLPMPMKATQQPKLMHSTQSPLPPHSITLYTLGNIRILTLECVHFCYSILSHSFFFLLVFNRFFCEKSRSFQEPIRSFGSLHGSNLNRFALFHRIYQLLPRACCFIFF